MSPRHRTALRRLRLLQLLQLAEPERLSAPLLLKLLRRDPDLAPDMTDVLRGLIWLEDRGLADTRVVDTLEGAATFARILAPGGAFLRDPRARLPGILNPAQCLEAARAP